MPETIRSFIAIELPATVIDEISEVQGRLRDYGFKVRWVRPENMHLTLKFLGDIPRAEIEKVARALIESAEEFAPITVHARGIGTFPSIKRPRVIWVGVAGQLEKLRKLQKSLDHKLAEAGFPKEKRAFKGHLTLGRVKNRIDPKRLMNAIQAFSGFESDPFAVDKVVVFKSELKPFGAVYSKLAEISLTVS